MKRAIKNHIGDFTAIMVLLVLSLGVAGYILTNERLRLPFLSSSQYTLNAAFTTAKAVTPGQGQTVNISGVQVGEIGGVTLKDGIAIVQLKIDSKFRKMIHENATALLRPRTGLEDMFVELQPGTGPSPVAPSGYTIPLSNTMPTIEADEILSSLDADTRAYLDLLVNGAGQGLKNNGGSELAQVFARFEPTHRDLARLNKAIAQRGSNLRRLIHSLNVLNAALAQKQVQITQLVSASAKVFRAFASEDRNVSRAVADLPSTLAQTTATLAKVTTFAHVLGPAAVNLLPAVKAIPAANQAITQLAKPSAPILQQQIRPFVVASRPLVQSLLPVSQDLASATPNLSGTFQVLNHLFNMLGYYPGGGQHGYLWWLAWLDHNARTLFSVQDANGVFRPLFLQFSCQQLSMFFNPPPQLGSFLTAVGTSILNLGPSHAACQAAGVGTNSGSSGGLPTLPLPKLAHDTSASHATSTKGKAG